MHWLYTITRNERISLYMNLHKNLDATNKINKKKDKKEMKKNKNCSFSVINPVGFIRTTF